MNVAIFTRRLLVIIAKQLPFFICAILLAYYTECLIAIYYGCYADLYDGTITLYTPFSWSVAHLFEYNVQILMFGAIMAVALETCMWNRLALLYDGFQLCEKNYLSEIEMSELAIYAIIITNILICAFFVHKGLKVLLQHKRKL